MKLLIDRKKWDKAVVFNGYPEECKCLCGYKCRPKCAIRTGDELIACLSIHFQSECAHTFDDLTKKCTGCGLTELEHRVRCGP